MLWLSLRGADWRKSRKKRRNKQRLGDREKGAMHRGGRENRITDGGELGKHGSHYGGDLTESGVIRIMCESIELLSVTILSAPRK